MSTNLLLRKGGEFAEVGLGLDDPSVRRPGRLHQVNIAVAGGPGVGKSTLAGLLFAKFKTHGFDYDLIMEESRKLKREFGHFESPFERFYMWRQQEREEERATAPCGFITDTPLFNLYAGAKQHFSGEKRERMAIRELWRMCLEIPGDRYAFIVLAADAYKHIIYKNESIGRIAPRGEAILRNNITVNLITDFWPKKVIAVTGSSEERAQQVFNHVMKTGALRNQTRTKLRGH